MGLSNSRDALKGRKISELPGVTYQGWKPLLRKGYEYVEQIEDLPLDQLEKLVDGRRKSLQNILEAIGRGSEYAVRYGPDSIMVDGTEIPMGVLRQLVTLVATARYFRFPDNTALQQAIVNGVRETETGELEEFGWEDIGRYKLESERAKAAVAREQVNEEAGGIPRERMEQFEKAVAVRMDQYRADYDTSLWTAADIQTLQWLVYNEIRLENLQIAQALASSGTAPAEQANKTRSEEITKLWDTIRKMRDELQLSLKARVDANKQTDAQQIVTDLATRGKQLLSKRASIFQHCGILQAIFIPNFPAHVDTKVVKVRCAKCGQHVDFQIVTPEIMAVYEEAGSFVPTDAPAGMFKETAK